MLRCLVGGGKHDGAVAGAVAVAVAAAGAVLSIFYVLIHKV